MEYLKRKITKIKKYLKREITKFKKRCLILVLISYINAIIYFIKTTVLFLKDYERTFFIYIEEQFIEEEINHIPFLFTEELLHLKAIDFIDNIEQYSLDSMKFLFQSNITSSSTVTTNNSNSTTPLANKVPLDNSYSISFISFYKFIKKTGVSSSSEKVTILRLFKQS